MMIIGNHGDDNACMRLSDWLSTAANSCGPWTDDKTSLWLVDVSLITRMKMSANSTEFRLIIKLTEKFLGQLTNISYTVSRDLRLWMKISMVKSPGHDDTVPGKRKSAEIKKNEIRIYRNTPLEVVLD